MKRSLVLLVAMIVAPTLFADAAAADGAAVYKSKCAICHGADGKGQTGTGKSLKLRALGSPQVKAQTNAQLTKIVVDGKKKMPAYKTKLSAAEIEAVVKFIRTLK
jgi:mono/diheme cytochrome c family protein